jgi:hypothetical protein
MADSNYSNEFYKRIDNLYRALKACDNELINSTNAITDDTQKVCAAYMFNISSYGLSFVNNVFLNNAHSLGTIMDMRCLFENIAMYEHFLNGGFSEEGIKLFKFQPYILERAVYRKYPCFDGFLLYLEDVEKHYNEAKAAYKGNLEIDAKTLAKLMQSPTPFLIKEDMPFVKIVEKNLGDVAAKIYKQLSVIIHPHDYRSNIDDIFVDVKMEKNPFIQITLHLLERVFEGLPTGKEIKHGLMEETLLYLENPVMTAYQMREILFSINDDLKNVLMLAYEYNLPALARMLDQIRHITTDSFLDTVFGYSEQGIIKWKVVVEYFAFFDYCLNNPYYLQANNLTYFHTQLKHMEIMDRDISQDSKDKCYAEYLKLFPNGVSKEKFAEAYGKTLGFLVNEQGEVPSLNELAKSYLSRASVLIDCGRTVAVAPKMDENASIQEIMAGVQEAQRTGTMQVKDLPLKEWLTMLYEESQIMSHATGYLYFANTGAWMDGQYLGYYIHKFMQISIERLCEVLSSEEMKTKLAGKTMRNITRNFLKNTKERVAVYGKMLQIPKTSKPKG